MGEGGTDDAQESVSGEQITRALRQVEGDTPVEEILRKLRVSQAAFFRGDVQDLLPMRRGTQPHR